MSDYQKMAYKIFDEVGLFKSFDIPVNAFIQYFIALENGYIDLPCKYLAILFFSFFFNFNLDFHIRSQQNTRSGCTSCGMARFI
jgi:hypothetical protein